MRADADRSARSARSGSTSARLRDTPTAALARSPCTSSSSALTASVTACSAHECLSGRRRRKIMSARQAHALLVMAMTPVCQVKDDRRPAQHQRFGPWDHPVCALRNALGRQEAPGRRIAGRLECYLGSDRIHATPTLGPRPSALPPCSSDLLLPARLAARRD